MHGIFLALTLTAYLLTPGSFLVSILDKEGPGLDPDGKTEAGPGLDPSGASAPRTEAGPGLDPFGHS